MRKIRGFKLGKRLVRASKWLLRKVRARPGYRRINPPSSKPKPISKLITWGRRLTNGAKTLCCRKPGSCYVPVGYESLDREKKVAVPKGHLAVYVGQQDGGFHRVLVPVIYFNHPLFGELLREAEQEYGHQHQGGITIPCQISDFERVKTRIAAAGSRGVGGRMLTWKRRY
jgi:SAUR family protein